MGMISPALCRCPALVARALQEATALKAGLRLQVELEELLGVPLEDLLNEHQLRCSTLAESGAPLPLPQAESSTHRAC